MNFRWFSVSHSLRHVFTKLDFSHNFWSVFWISFTNTKSLGGGFFPTRVSETCERQKMGKYCPLFGMKVNPANIEMDSRHQWKSRKSLLNYHHPRWWMANNHISPISKRTSRNLPFGCFLLYWECFFAFCFLRCHVSFRKGMGFPLLGVSVLKSAVFMQLVTMVCFFWNPEMY